MKLVYKGIIREKKNSSPCRRLIIMFIIEVICPSIRTHSHGRTLKLLQEFQTAHMAIRKSDIPVLVLKCERMRH